MEIKEAAFKSGITSYALIIDSRCQSTTADPRSICNDKTKSNNPGLGFRQKKYIDKRR